MEKEKKINETVAEEVEETASVATETEEGFEPTVIRINDVKYERVIENDEEEEEKFDLKKHLYKRPNESMLKKYAMVSFGAGILSCSLFLGNFIFAIVGILFSVIAKKHKYNSIYSTVGLWTGIVGILAGIIISIIVLVVVVLVVALLAALVALVFIYTPAGEAINEFFNTLMSIAA